jgi:DNA-binding transcriptional MocR family regulator
VDSLTVEIRAGKLPPGTRLPTHRHLAAKEGIALVTASRIYAELAAKGLVSGETGRGTFVRELVLSAGHGIDQQATAPEMLDLSFNYPALPEQTELLRAALRRIASSGDLEALLRYQPHAGRSHEREIIARHVASRGLPATADQVLIVNGAQHGLASVIMAMLAPGDVVAVDSLTYSGFKALAEMQRLELLPIPFTDEGPDLNELDALCLKRKVRAVYVMPTLHNPLGWVMSLEQRRELTLIAHRHQLLIIEDASYAFLVDNAPAPVAALAPESTIYVSGFSKSMATGLRVGYVVAPVRWVPSIERAIRTTTWNTPSLMTAIACEWIEDGTVVRMEVEKRKDARVRQALVRKILDGLVLSSHPASYFVWIHLPLEVRADQVVAQLFAANIAVSSAEPFATSKHVPHAIRLALGSVALDQLEQALQRVASAIYDFSCGVVSSH